MSGTSILTDKHTYVKLLSKHGMEKKNPLNLTQTHTNKEPSVQIKQIFLDVSSPLSGSPRDVKLGGTHFRAEILIT